MVATTHRCRAAFRSVGSSRSQRTIRTTRRIRQNSPMKARNPLNWSWGLAALLLANLAHTACGQGEIVLSSKWSVDATSRPYLGTNSNWPRGAMINRTTGHVLVPTTAPSNQVAILSGADGSDLGNLNVNGLTGGHTASFNI